MALEALAYRRIPQARVQVFDWPIVAVPGGFRGGPVLPEEADTPLRHTRRRRPVDSFRADETYDETLAGQYVYAGPVWGHFGHYMAEFVHRLVTARLRGLRFPPLFVSSQGHNPHPTYGEFPEVMKEVLAFVGIRPQEAKVVNRNTIVEVLHVIEAGSDLVGGPKPDYVEALTGFATPKLDARHGATRRPARLYVSRSALPPQGMVLGEAWFEQHLERAGFTIFRPEEWRFSPQLDHYRKAEVVVFPEGSACHGTELLGAGMMGRCFILPRRAKGEVFNFQRILEPRSRAFAILAGCTDYLGSAAMQKGTGEALSHLGVSWLNLDRIAAAFRDHDLAELDGLSARDYAAAAAADLDRYLAFQARPGGPFDAGLAERLKEAFAARAAADLATGA